MGKSLKEFLVKDRNLQEKEAQDLVDVAFSIRKYNSTFFDVIAEDMEIFKWSDKSYKDVGELQRRLLFLNELGLVEYNPRGVISLTKKGSSYFNQKP